jgi:hypothetical protein
MFYIIYVSDAKEPFSNTELVELLIKSRASNTKLNISGMLLYKDGSFMQFLEGEESEVRKLLTVIDKDPRHQNIKVLEEGISSKREFGEWAMGFKNLDGLLSETVEGYTNFMDLSLTSSEFFEAPTSSLELLIMFRGYH